MTPELEAAIRARADADHAGLLILESLMPASDDEALLATVHTLRDRVALLALVDELRKAAAKVTCGNCMNEHWGVPRGPCPDCAPLRALLDDRSADRDASSPARDDRA